MEPECDDYYDIRNNKPSQSETTAYCMADRSCTTEQPHTTGMRAVYMTTRAEYAADCVAAVQAVLEEKSRQAQAEQEQKHAAELEASRIEAGRQQKAAQQLQEAARQHELEAVQLRAELAQLKEKSECLYA